MLAPAGTVVAPIPVGVRPSKANLIELLTHQMAHGGMVTKAKARKILADGTIRGRRLTKRQRGLFGIIAGGGTPTRVRRAATGFSGNDATAYLGQVLARWPNVTKNDVAALYAYSRQYNWPALGGVATQLDKYLNGGLTADQAFGGVQSFMYSLGIGATAPGQPVNPAAPSPTTVGQPPAQYPRPGTPGTGSPTTVTTPPPAPGPAPTPTPAAPPYIDYGAIKNALLDSVLQAVRAQTGERSYAAPFRAGGSFYDPLGGSALDVAQTPEAEQNILYGNGVRPTAASVASFNEARPGYVDFLRGLTARDLNAVSGTTRSTLASALSGLGLAPEDYFDERMRELAGFAGVGPYQRTVYSGLLGG